MCNIFEHVLSGAAAVNIYIHVETAVTLLIFAALAVNTAVH